MNSHTRPSIVEIQKSSSTTPTLNHVKVESSPSPPPTPEDEDEPPPPIATRPDKTKSIVSIYRIETKHNLTTNRNHEFTFQFPNLPIAGIIELLRLTSTIDVTEVCSQQFCRTVNSDKSNSWVPEKMFDLYGTSS